MSQTIHELYMKYIDAVSSLEDDRYFRYLFELVQSSDNILQQNRQVLHKVVDETWLTVIEDSLDALNTIVEKPRRFVATTEEVVPVSLAKKITAHSVRHLSMNTQFIASNENGDIQPTRVLNVTQEDSYDLYENRFIYHLIQKLVVFIDKRTDVLFWSTGDEVRNTMVLESKIDDAYEEIEYKVEIKVKNRQSFAENDTDNMDVFMRIDRVRRMAMALHGSAFCELMAGCAKVRSPIQRTNLLMKDPNYRKCYQLWQFLESYEDIGYTIEEQNAALEFDEEYLIQMYINLIANYAVFKSLSEEVEDRNLDELSKAFRQVLKPKFVKQIQEEIVDDYNIPEVEVRKVIIEEATQAQLDAEAKLAEETALREQAEAARDAAEIEMQQAMSRSQQFMEQMMDAQEQTSLAQAMQAAAEQARDASEAAKAAAEEQRAAAIAEKLAAEDACRAAEAERSKAVSCAQDAEQARQEAQAACSQAEQRAAQAERCRADAEQARDAALVDKENALAAEREAKTAMHSAEAALSEAQARAEEAVSAKREAEHRQAEAQKAMEEALAGREQSLQAQLDAEARASADREAKALAEQACAAAMQAKQQAADQAEQANRAAAQANEKAAAGQAECERLEEQLKAALAAIQQAEQARQAAENARRSAEADAEAHRAARENAEAAMKAAELVRQAAEQETAAAAKREKTLRDQLAKCEKKLEKTKKKLESSGTWPWTRIGRK